MLKETPRVERGKIELIIDHEGEELAFVHPPQGPHNYQTVGKGILARKLTIPTAHQTVSLLSGAYNSQEPEFSEVQEIIKNKWLWVFNRNLWTPDGVYIIDDPEAVGISQPLNPAELEKRLSNSPAGSPICYSSDSKVRFAPKESYKLGEHTQESLSKDGFIIASFGKKGASKLGEVSTHFKQTPYVRGLNLKSGQEPVQRVSALSSDWDDRGLYVGGYLRGYWVGCAFGV